VRLWCHAEGSDFVHARIDALQEDAETKYREE